MSDNSHAREILKSLGPKGGDWSEGTSATGSDGGLEGAAGKRSPPVEPRPPLLFPPSGSPHGPTEVSATLKNDRILVVEDNIVNQKVLCAMLRQLGFLNVVVALNGEEALEFITGSHTAEPFDLCFMDCLMPVMDGWAATREIRTWESQQMREPAEDAEAEDEGKTARKLTIIALTAHVTMRDRDECHASGMDDFMVKPVSIEQVKSALMQWLPSAFESLPNGVNASEIKRWPHSIVSHESTRIRAGFGAPASAHSMAATSVSGTSTALEEVGALLQASLSSQDGDYEDRVLKNSPSIAAISGKRRKTLEFSPLLIESSALGRSKARSVASDTPPSSSMNLASMYNMDMMKSSQSLLRKQSPVLEQMDLPSSDVPNDILSRALGGLRYKRSPETAASLQSKIISSSPLLDSGDRKPSNPFVDAGLPLPPPPASHHERQKNSLASASASLKTLKVASSAPGNHEP